MHLDDFGGLRATYSSLRQALRKFNISWLVIDGGSKVHSDDADTLFRNIRADTTYFISEPDRGIYDGMNKGTRHAVGDYVLYLNAGDELNPAFSPADLETELGDDRPEMIWGRCFERFPDGTLVKLKNRSPALAWYGMPVNHQNVLFRRDTLGTKPYREEYVYCADYDLVSRLMTSGSAVFRTTIPIAIFKRGGASTTHFMQAMAEEEALRSLHFGVNSTMSRGLTYVKWVNKKLGSFRIVRRLLRKWV